MSLVTGLFFLVLLLNQRWSPPFRLQASHCSTFRIMCDVPSTAVFCSESIECFPGTVSKFFLKLLVTIPVAPITTGTTVHFRFHIRCISIHKLLYFNFFSASFSQHFCLRVLPHLSACMFSLFCFNYYIWPVCCNFSLCVYCLIRHYYYYYISLIYPLSEIYSINFASLSILILHWTANVYRSTVKSRSSSQLLAKER